MRNGVVTVVLVLAATVVHAQTPAAGPPTPTGPPATPAGPPPTGLIVGSGNFFSPIVGDLHFQMSNTWLAPRSGHRLQVFVPAEAETERRLARLLSLAPQSSSTS